MCFLSPLVNDDVKIVICDHMYTKAERETVNLRFSTVKLSRYLSFILPEGKEERDGLPDDTNVLN